LRDLRHPPGNDARSHTAEGYLPRSATDLVTVPACAECNQGSSELDERFRAYLSLHVGLDSPATKTLWQRALPRICRRPSFRNQLLAQIKPVFLQSRQNILVGRGYRLPWDSSVHKAVIDRTIRGLYFHHYGGILGDRVALRTHWFGELKPDLVEVSLDWGRSSIGGDQFVYRFARAEDEPRHSTWLFQFHRRHWAGGHTSPIKAVAPPNEALGEFR
jgi:hypothetical protein